MNLPIGGTRRPAGSASNRAGIALTPYLRQPREMKTTVEIPDRLFRDAKTAAASRGLSLKTFLTEALMEKLARPHPRHADWPVPPPQLAEGEVQRIQATIDGEFSRVDPKDWK